VRRDRQRCMKTDRKCEPTQWFSFYFSCMNLGSSSVRPDPIVTSWSNYCRGADGKNRPSIKSPGDAFFCSLGRGLTPTRPTEANLDPDRHTTRYLNLP
jgi:hypothetical protein